ncbi:MAG: thiamine pyrophosphate-dependent enzyme, partial [Opitutales bacterium]
MSGIFYETFERHAHGQGLKGHSTHYCPGCGHGVVHRDLAEIIAELGAQDRTILISPVGCAVFAYYYFDVGNSQAAHGRAPVVAIGHKLANPGALVVSYQGDGDLASIGLAETISVAQLGIPITVIFINNAIYGMTGGQMAPTSLIGQKTATSPDGRNPATQGLPLRMAELIAQLDGPVYVERVALYDAKNRVKARKAIKKALTLQSEGRGYSFIEVLSECPTHLRLSPTEAEKWVKEKMEPVYPLGVKKDVTIEPWFNGPNPSFEPDAVLAQFGAERAGGERHTAAWPAHL